MKLLKIAPIPPDGSESYAWKEITTPAGCTQIIIWTALVARGCTPQLQIRKDGESAFTTIWDGVETDDLDIQQSESLFMTVEPETIYRLQVGSHDSRETDSTDVIALSAQYGETQLVTYPDGADIDDPTWIGSWTGVDAVLSAYTI